MKPIKKGNVQQNNASHFSSKRCCCSLIALESHKNTRGGIGIVAFEKGLACIKRDILNSVFKKQKNNVIKSKQKKPSTVQKANSIRKSLKTRVTRIDRKSFQSKKGKLHSKSNSKTKKRAISTKEMCASRVNSKRRSTLGTKTLCNSKLRSTKRQKSVSSPRSKIIRIRPKRVKFSGKAA
ncbi:unnamed protein product [Orchesella dallaii]|uniref:Uncharacterized protein n=1 Tax=Orchesella dallaii TaxID=48710 RepID=A0ABP1S7C1_9HEXA